MDIGPVLDAARLALQMALLLGGPALLAALVVGLLVGAGQTLTQLHDPVVSLVPRLLAVLLVVLVLLPWMLDRWVSYARDLFGSIPGWL